MSDRHSAHIIEAHVALLSPREGGRRSAIASGYRCNCWIGRSDAGQRVYSDATMNLVNQDRLEPGDAGLVQVKPHLPDDWSNLTVGSRFELCEGSRVIGIATVTRFDVSDDRAMNDERSGQV